MKDEFEAYQKLTDPEELSALDRFLFAHIRRNGPTSCVDLEAICKVNKINYRGDLNFCSQKNDNWVLWTGWNAEIIESLYRLRRARLIHFWEADKGVYFLDEKRPALPEGLHGWEYDTPHWMPIELEARATP